MKDALAKTVFTGCNDCLGDRTELTIYIDSKDSLYFGIENRIKYEGKRKESRYNTELSLDLETCEYLAQHLTYLVKMLKESEREDNG
jgi:hypothetical protein